MQSLNWPSSRPLQLVITLLAIGLLIFSWLTCYTWTMLITEGWGAPWDTAPLRPPDGYWQRSINDFFESGIGMYLPTAIFLAISVLLYVRALLYTRDIGTTSFIFGVTNLVAMLVLMVIVALMNTFLVRTPANLTPQDWSYWGDLRREWPLTLVALVWFSGLFVVQSRLSSRLAKNSASTGQE